MLRQQSSGDGWVTVSILQAHIASTSRAKRIRTEGVEEDVVLCLIELYILPY